MTIRYRQTWRQVLPYGVVLFGVMALSSRPTSPRLVDMLSAAAVAGAAILGVRHAGVVVTPETITVTRLRRRTIPWSRVEAVEPLRTFGGRGVPIVVDGRRRALPVPVDTPFLAPDPAFDEKAATIERYWRDATSAGAP